MKVLQSLLLLLTLAACRDAASGVPGSALRGPPSAWHDWDMFASRFVQDDGRVIDLTFDQKSTSEGQSYGLFFALVANDRVRFERILNWTSENLAGRALGKRLPAWHWGKRDDGSWGVKDENAASDGDIWIAYALLEAARLWNRPDYAGTGRALLHQVAEREVAKVGDVGPMLLPGPYGFELSGGRYRVDPSYLPPFLLQYLETVDEDGPWLEIHRSHLQLAPQVYRKGVAPDLFVVDGKGKVFPDTDRPGGGYDAIRVYLWAAMSGSEGEPLMKMLGRYAQLVDELGAPPEQADAATGQALKTDFSPMGFSGAVLPFLQAGGHTEALRQQLKRLPLRLRQPTNYYDEALILFGTGWLDGFYRFDAQGRLLPRWHGAGSAAGVAQAELGAGQQGEHARTAP